MVERMEEKLEAAFGDQKRIFLIIFQRFIMILSEHLVKCDTDGRDYNTDWYRWTIGRLQQVFLTVRSKQIDKMTLIWFQLICRINQIKIPSIPFFPHAAPRASPQIFQHVGELAVHTSRLSYSRCFPTVCGFDVLIRLHFSSWKIEWTSSKEDRAKHRRDEKNWA